MQRYCLAVGRPSDSPTHRQRVYRYANGCLRRCASALVRRWQDLLCGLKGTMSVRLAVAALAYISQRK